WQTGRPSATSPASILSLCPERWNERSTKRLARFLRGLMANRISCPWCDWNGKLLQQYHGQVLICPRCKANLPVDGAHPIKNPNPSSEPKNGRRSYPYAQPVRPPALLPNPLPTLAQEAKDSSPIRSRYNWGAIALIGSLGLVALVTLGGLVVATALW